MNLRALASTIRSTALTAAVLTLQFAVCAPESRATPADLAEQIRGNDAPVLRLNTSDPAAAVTALAFSPDGKTLYGGGWDKVIYVWQLDAQGEFQAQPDRLFRIPLGPGENGAINQLAVSPDGGRLAVGGFSVVRDSVGFRDKIPGIMIPPTALTVEQQLDIGNIFVFDTRSGQLSQSLRGCEAAVEALSFVQGPAGQKNAWLVAAASLREAASAPASRRIYLFDTVAGTLLGQNALPAIKDVLPGPPSIAAMVTSNDPRSARVGVAWRENKFYEWQPFQGNRLLGRDHLSCQACTVRSDQRDFVWGQKGGIWFGDPPTGPKRVALEPSWLPTALAPVRIERTGDHFSVVMGKPTAAGSGLTYALALVRADGQFVGQPISLWQGRAPICATSPNGSHVAVANPATQRILVFRAADLLQPAAEPRQIMEPSATVVRRVSFAQNNDGKLGLLLGWRDDPNWISDPSNIAVNLSDNALTDAAGWKVVAPPSSGWTAEWQANRDDQANRDNAVITVRDPRAAIRKILLPARVRILSLVFGPVDNAGPLLAVSASRNGRPYCQIYQSATGERLRQLEGPLDIVGALAFSPDGLFLAGASSDRTIHVWRLRDLANGRTPQGSLRGLVVRTKNQRVVVDRIAEDMYPGALQRYSQLAPGDVVEGLRVANKTIPLQQAWDFYREIKLQPVGQRIELTVVRDGQRSFVPVTVEQAVDQRLPHFSLYVDQDAPTKRWSWIAWTPSGPFTASDRRIEELVGWHFNTNDPRQPAQFASLSKYRKFHRQGLLGYLLEHDAPPAEGPLPDPRMSFRLRNGDQVISPGSDGQILWRTGERRELSLVVSQIPPADVAKVTVSSQERPPIELQRSERDLGIWSRALRPADLGLDRGIHRLAVVLHCRGEDAHTFELTPVPLVRVQAPVPQSTVTTLPEFAANAATPQTATTQEFALEIQVANPQQARVTLQHRYRVEGNLKDDSANIDIVGQNGRAKRAVNLSPGLNDIELVVSHPQPLANYESWEQESRRWLIHYEAPQHPTVAVDWVELPDGKRVPLVLGRVLDVDAPEVTVHGRIASGEPLKRVERIHSDANRNVIGQSQVEVATEAGERTFSQKLKLQPGRQKIELAVRTASAEDRFWWELNYRPRISLTPPQVLEPLLGTMLPPQSQPSLTIAVTPPPEPHEYEIQYVVNGKVLDQSRGGVQDRHTSRPLALRPGSNNVVVRLQNKWGTIQESAPWQLHVARPPEPPTIAGPNAPVMSAACDLSLQVISQLKPERVHLQNGDTKETRSVVFQAQGADNIWETTLVAVPLTVGANELLVSVENAEGRSPVNRVRVECARPQPDTVPPLVELATAEELTVPTSAAVVRFRVRSASEIVEIECTLNGRVEPVAPASGVKERDFVLYEVGLTLHPERINDVTIVVRDRQGKTSAPQRVRLSVVQPPVWLELLQIEEAINAGRLLPLQQQGPGIWEMETPIRCPTVRIQGKLHWSGDVNPEQAPVFIKSWANGFLQADAVSLGAANQEAKTQPFTVVVTLNRKEENRILLELPHFPSQTAHLRIRACERPDTEQRLQIIVVDVGAQRLNENDLDQYLEVLRMSNAFRAGVELNTVSQEVVSASQIRGLLDDYRTYALGLGVRNQALLLYFHGRVREREDREFSLVTNPRVPNRVVGDDPEDRLTSQELESHLEETGGAHLLFLDTLVAGEAAGTWPSHSRLGVIRASWREDHTVPLKERILAHLSAALKGSSPPITFAQLSQNLPQTYQKANLDKVRLDSHVPETGIDLIVLLAP